MSFKTFKCYTESIGPETIPVEGWDVQGDAIIISSAGVTFLGQFTCDPAISGFIGANNVQPGMTQDEFYALWPLLMLLMTAGFIWKLIARQFP